MALLSIFERFLMRETAKVKRMTDSLDVRVMDCAKALGVEVLGHDLEPLPRKLDYYVNRPEMGFYNYPEDTVVLNPYAILREESCINLTLAHELIHATGHAQRLKRGHIEIGRAHV